MITLNQKNEKIKTIMEALESGKKEDLKAAIESFYDGIYESVKADFVEFQQTGDEKALAQRGYRQLTSEEKNFYEALIKSAKSDKPKETLLTEIPDAAVPTTVIEDVFREITETHPLLDAINMNFAGTAIKWILSDHESTKARWGKITDAITKEIESGLKEIDITQNKLSAFVYLPQGLIEMGPRFLDAYVRAILTEAIACGAEDGFVSGTGIDSPIGMIRDIHEGVSVNSTTGYPAKEAISLSDLTPTSYGALLAKLAVTEKGNNRTFDKVTLICNQSDFLTKIMPATTVMNADGTYARDIFPFATDVVISSALETGKALVGLPEEYSAFIGNGKTGVIESSDEYKFLEDLRTYKIKMYGTGRAYDNTCWLLVDISELAPTYLTVNVAP